MQRTSPLAILAAWAALASVAEAQTLTRGPYLQQGAPTEVTLRWRTSSASNSRVRYGSAPGSLTQVRDDAAAVTEHVVRLTGLSADTTYYYSVGSSTAVLAGGDANHFFLTSPAVGTPKPTRIWVLGDAGTATSAQAAVRDAYYAFTGTRHTDLWLMLGDNAYNDGTDAEYQDAVFDVYPTMLRKSVLWSTFGNHDGHSASSSTQTGPYYSLFTFPKAAEAGGTASGTEAYYSFDYGNIHVVNLDSEGSSLSSTGAMANWLRSDLASTSQEWLIVMFHHPPYTKGSHDSDSEGKLVSMRQVFNPILEAAGVDLVLSGHSHSYERSYLIDGHYGTSGTFSASHKIDGGNGRAPAPYAKPGGLAANQGAVYAVAGSSGKISGGALNHPAMVVSLNLLGSLVIDVAGNRMDVKFLRETRAVDDFFSIVKGGTADTTAPAISITAPTTSTTHTASSTPLALGGTASDNVGVTAVTWSNAATGGTGTASGTTSWTASIALAAGANAITVRAQDAAGNVSTDTITATYAPGDAIVPVIQIATPTTSTTHTASSSPLALGGTASDNVGVTAVTWSNAATGGAGTASGTTSWTASIALVAGANAITVRAQDAAGNVSTDAVTVTYVPPAGDSTPPLLTVVSPSATPYSTTSEPLMVSGDATDNVGVAAVTWSNAATGESGTASGTSTWSASIPLAAGSNAVTITALDGAGNAAQRVLTLVYTAAAPPPAVAAGRDNSNGDLGINDSCGATAGSAPPWAGIVALLLLCAAFGRRA
ncbi:MAG TPA: metallophosphoesterase [Planctomycetota bacterium]